MDTKQQRKQKKQFQMMIINTKKPSGWKAFFLPFNKETLHFIKTQQHVETSRTTGILTEQETQ